MNEIMAIFNIFFYHWSTTTFRFTFWLMEKGKFFNFPSSFCRCLSFCWLRFFLRSCRRYGFFFVAVLTLDMCCRFSFTFQFFSSCRCLWSCRCAGFSLSSPRHKPNYFTLIKSCVSSAPNTRNSEYWTGTDRYTLNEMDTGELNHQTLSLGSHWVNITKDVK